MKVEEREAPQWRPIEKSTGLVAPNLGDYDAQARAFSWERLTEELFERADDRMNMASLAIESFSPQRLIETTPEEISDRVAALHRMVSFRLDPPF